MAKYKKKSDPELLLVSFCDIVTVTCVELFTTVENVTSPLFGSNRTFVAERKFVPVKISGTLVDPAP